MAAFEPELVVAAEVFAAPGPTSRVFSSAKKLLGNGPEFFGPVAAGADPVAPVVAGALFPVAGAAAVVVPVVPAPVVAVDPVEPEAAGAVEPALDDVEEALVVAGAFGAPGPTSRTFSSAKKLLGKGPESFGPVEAGADPVAPAALDALVPVAGAAAVVVPVVPAPAAGVDPVEPAAADPAEPALEDVAEAVVVAGAFGAPGPTSRTFSSAKKLLGKGPESLGPVEAGADPVAPAPAGAPLAAAGAEAPVVPVAGGGVDPLAPAVVDPEEFVGEDEVAAEAEFDPLAAEVVEPEVAAGVDPV